MTRKLAVSAAILAIAFTPYISNQTAQARGFGGGGFHGGGFHGGGFGRGFHGGFGRGFYGGYGYYPGYYGNG